ncbi:pseudouridine synthase [Sphingobacterium kyonggiense]|uniref:Pseudouridine synthase n=1 Tax=Sphingobacterium kyonggiense TaxID=714075 RepID=A0ABP7YT86_9SPHI
MPFSSNRNSRDDNSRRNRSNSESFGDRKRTDNKGSFNSNRDSNRKSDKFRNNDGDSGFKKFDRDSKFGRPDREGGFKKFDRDNRDDRSSRPDREGGFKKFDRDNRDDRSSRPDREGGFKKFDRDNRDNRSGRPEREGGFKKFDRDNRDNRSGRPEREGGFKKFDRDSRDNRSGRTEREGGFKKFDRDSRDNRSGRPEREGGFKKFDRDSRDNRSGRPEREGGFKKFDRDNRDSRGKDFGDRRRDSRSFQDRDNRNDNEDRGERKTIFRSRKPASDRTFKEAEDDGLIRLNRYIANSGICSRRKADELIEAGVISVNGEVVTELGTKVDPAKDEIKYNDERLKREKMVYVLLNKPKDYITTTDDPQERKTVMQLVSKATKERIYPIGRLDRNTTGLLLLTNDGNLAEKLSHPRNNISKIYQVELDKSLTQGDFNKIQFGIELEDGFIKPDDVSYVMGASKREIGIQIHSGKNRVVRRIFESLGYDVVKLDRVVYANLTKKDLPRGRWRFLDDKEIIQLKHLMK